jgi:hypothetical protein
MDPAVRDLHPLHSKKPSNINRKANPKLSANLLGDDLLALFDDAIVGLGNDHFWRLRQNPCAINRFEAEGGAFTMGSLDETYHLRSKI